MATPATPAAAPLGDPPTGWTLVGDHLHREWEFAGFTEAWAFMTRVAAVAEQLDHHPDWSNSFNRVVIDLCSHDRGRTVTRRDHRLAAAINELEP